MSLLPLLLASPAIAVAAQEPVPVPAAAPQVPPPDELVLEGDNIITVMVNGTPLRLEVDADSFGPPVINSEVAARLQLVAESRRGWRFGSVVVEGVNAVQLVDFGGGPLAKTISWAERFASRKADGTIGVHHLPYARVTFVLAPPVEGETVQRFPMKRSGSEAEARLGTEVVVGTKKLMMIFALKRAENLITAPTANFIATHQDGGFEPGSDGTAIMNFAVERPTRMMRIAEPIMLGDLVVDRFAVRVEDYGDPKRVGEIGENDPRFDKGQILVSRRKGRGRPDLLTRIGRDQIAHCSQITYDLAQSEIRLSCGPAPE
ncbi:hypothetical protein FHS52_000242 [Erythromicrobium ramosum]|uniref:Peptidylprolyl isomerase n=1 Tax=Erythrobacter ramosus TaxID=35811 RepID=A0A6I4UJQ7_9SPHN|nr:hypothetical protein [Erythrobacter ramosus]MBB3774299.1 hypothetical protein [Erythrobacter ramosus]MXP38044.1 hypothetical protein [Erythrobacter ramosus]